MATRQLLPLPALAFAILLLLTVGIYAGGLPGGFLFDDTPNLKALGADGGVVDWSTFRAYLTSGFAGPTGRPLSLLSFLLDDNDWPSNAAWFKPTNLALHLLCGLLLAWATLLLLRRYGSTEARAQWAAVFIAGAWLLHPFLVSTTLYVVQRMSQLAALFVLAGLCGYLHGRGLLAARPRAAYRWMGGAILLGTLFAVLSKENGALLPLLIGVIEFCWPQDQRNPRPALVFRALFLWLPSLAILAYLASTIDFAPDRWPHRPFNQLERLLTQPRILWDYLANWFLPRIEGQGLYRDDIVISRDLFTPASTLPAIVGLVGLTLTALLMRRRWPLFSLAVLFFLAAHLIESSVIGLELYFEHRNYLPAVFLFLPLLPVCDTLARRVSRRVGVLLPVLILALLASMTWQRVQLWQDTERLQIYWATKAVDSPRAQNALASYYARLGLIDEGIAHIEDAAARMSDSGLLRISVLLHKVRVGRATAADFVSSAQKMAAQPFDGQAVMGLRVLTELLTDSARPEEYRVATHDLLNRLLADSSYNQSKLFVELLPYLRGQLYLASAKPALASEQFAEAVAVYQDIDAGLKMVALTGNAGYYQEALQLLEKAETLYQTQPNRRLKHSRRIYDREIARIRATLLEELGR